MIVRHGIPVRLTAAERELRDRLRAQCEAWIDRHFFTLWSALDQARIEHDGCDDLQPPELRVQMRADLLRFEPSLSVVGSIVFNTEDLDP